MPYKVIGDKCRIGGRLLPIGTTLADNQILGAAAEALLASKQIAVAPTPVAPSTPTPAPAKTQAAG